MLAKLMAAFKTIDNLDIPKDAKDLLILKTMAMLLSEELYNVA